MLSRSAASSPSFFALRIPFFSLLTDDHEHALDDLLGGRGARGWGGGHFGLEGEKRKRKREKGKKQILIDPDSFLIQNSRLSAKEEEEEKSPCSLLRSLSFSLFSSCTPLSRRRARESLVLSLSSDGDHNRSSSRSSNGGSSSPSVDDDDTHR